MKFSDDWRHTTVMGMNVFLIFLVSRWSFFGGLENLNICIISVVNVGVLFTLP